MAAPWRSLSKAEIVRIVAPNGDERCRTKAYFAGKIFIVEDMSADMQPGDELRRTLPTGKDDVYQIVDPALYDTGSFPRHYQVKVARKGTFEHNAGGYMISVTGPNSRVNINSTDNSTNIAYTGDLFGDMRNAINAGVADTAKRSEIIAAIDEAEQSKGSSGFLSSYQKVVATAADHLGLLTPFLPALTGLLA